MMRYCEETTKNHIINSSCQCLQKINGLILEEGCQEGDSLFYKNEIALNTDSAERQINKSFNKSVDFAFGITNFKKRQIQLVELKFNLNPNYLKKQELEEKVQGTTSLLGNNPEIRQVFFIVFPADKVPEAYNRLFRINPRIDSKFQIISIKDLNVKYFQS